MASKVGTHLILFVEQLDFAYVCNQRHESTPVGVRLQVPQRWVSRRRLHECRRQIGCAHNPGAAHVLRRRENTYEEMLSVAHYVECATCGHEAAGAIGERRDPPGSSPQPPPPARHTTAWQPQYPRHLVIQTPPLLAAVRGFAGRCGRTTGWSQSRVENDRALYRHTVGAQHSTGRQFATKLSLMNVCASCGLTVATGHPTRRSSAAQGVHGKGRNSGRKNLAKFYCAVQRLLIKRCPEDRHGHQ